MRKVLFTFFTIILFSAIPLAAQSAKTSANAQLTDIVPKIVASWETFDLSKISPYYADDSDLTFFDLSPMKYDNWAEYKAGAQKAFFDVNKSMRIKIAGLRIHTHGTFAWATFTFGADLVSKQDASSHVDGRWTMILEKRGARWVVVHEHVSAPLATP